MSGDVRSSGERPTPPRGASTALGAVKRFFRRYRVALGYLTVAAIFGPLLLWGLDLVPLLEERLADHGYEMRSPEWLVLIAGVPLFWFIRLHTLTDLPLLQQWLSTLVRCVMVVALAVAMTEITHTRSESRKVATVFVVDVSASVPEPILADAQAALQAAWDARGDGTVRLVTFATDASAVPLVPDSKGTLPALQRADGDAGLTSNLQAGIRIGFGLFPPGHLRRMVVVTDGNETWGDALAEVEAAARLGVRVHYREVSGLILPTELMVLGFEVPDDIEANIPFLVSAYVRASRPMMAECTLAVQGEVVKTERRLVGTKLPTEVGTKLPTEVGSELTTIDFQDIRVKDGGEYAFKVDCKPAASIGSDGQPGEAAPTDRVSTNNSFETSRKVPKKKKFLYVEGETLYSKNFKDAMSDDFEVELRGPKGLPGSLEGLQEFQGILISDVPLEGAYYKQNITTGQQKLLHDYVKGGGLLIFTGGGQSLGPGGYSGSYLEKQVLPVKLDVENELDTPRLALVIAMDRSGSMKGRLIELAKKAARETVAALDKRDTVGIVAFDAEAQKLIGLTPATSKARFDRVLATMTADGGTNIGQGLAVAFEMLEGVEAQLKHVILLTDGQSDTKGILAMVRDNAGRGVTVSTVAVGKESATSLLAQIAEQGNGRYYYTEDAEAVPRLFLDETKEIAGESVKQEPVKASLVSKFASLKFLKGIDISRAPTLDGYLPMEAKPATETILKIAGGKDPLLVRWQRGKGWVYVFASDIKNKWARRWLAWLDFAPFWRQLVKDAMPEEEKETVFPIQLTAQRRELRIGVDAVLPDGTFALGVISKASVLGPSGEKQEVTLTSVAPGRYEAVVPATAFGVYKVDVVHEKDGKKVAISSGRGAYPYPEEHLAFAPDLSRVAQMSDATGGIKNPTPATLFATGGESTTFSSPAWHFPLYLVLLALALDVFLRRVRLWKAKTLQWGA